MTSCRIAFCLAVALTLALLPACRSPQTDAATAAIIEVMHDAEAGWNSGDLEAYMDGYERSDDLRFAGGDRVNYGWHAVLASYQRGYPDKAAMGRLEFTELDVDVLSDDAAIVFGRWRLYRDADEPHGLFTLVFRRTGGAWRIVHDHTSAAD